MKFSIKILESNSQIMDMILDKIIDTVKPALQKISNNLNPKLTLLLTEKIKAQPEYNALINGQLKYEFGIPESLTAVNNIIEIWANNFFISSQNISKKSNGISGSFVVNMIKDDFSDVLSSPYAVVYDNNGTELPWLQWLLLDGSKIIVRNHEVKIGPSRFSRTGMAIMIDSTNNWRVPPEYAGTKTNNWVTRALQDINDELDSLILKELEKII